MEFFSTVTSYWYTTLIHLLIVERVTKSSCFLVVKTTESMKNCSKLYIDEIIMFHGDPLTIISGRGPLFTCHCWKAFEKGRGIHVNHSTTFHPQMMFSVTL